MDRIEVITIERGKAARSIFVIKSAGLGNSLGVRGNKESKVQSGRLECLR